MVKQHSKFALVVWLTCSMAGSAFAMQPSSANALVLYEDKSRALVPTSHGEEALRAEQESSTMKIYKQLLEIQSLQDQIAMRKKLHEEIDSKKEKHSTLRKKVGEIVKDGVGGGVDFVAGAAVDSAKFCIKVGVVAVIVGFGGTLIFRAVTTDGYHPIDLAGKGLWTLFKVGVNSADFVLKKFPGFGGGHVPTTP